MSNTPRQNINMPPVVTRFAPSPTGFLHIGGARTALFNWLFARRHGGKFLLRIEDTDRARHNEAAVSAILDGLSWLGLDTDGPVVSQYEQRARHVDIALSLLDAGHAYRCYLTPDETNALRDQTREANARFESPWRSKTSADYPADKPYAIRFKAPLEGDTRIDDAVQGSVSVPNSALDDLIILRSATSENAIGEPTYNLAVVVDDHDMGVTHVIRGDDHLINGARQSQIYDALGWTRPTFAHIPLIHGPDGKKLSKRHGALGVEAYRDDGYLADGLANYLLRLGWAHGDEEIVSRDRAIDLFDLEGVNKAPARLDFDKLAHVNAHYIAELSDDAFIAAATPFIKAAGHTITPSSQAQIQRAAPFLKTRSDTLIKVAGAAAFILEPTPFYLSGKKAKPLRKEGTRDILLKLHTLLKDSTDWSCEESLAALLQSFGERHEIGFGQFGPPLRALLTAGHPSPDLGAVLFSLGQDESLRRIIQGLENNEVS